MVRQPESGGAGDDSTGMRENRKEEIMHVKDCDDYGLGCFYKVTRYMLEINQTTCMMMIAMIVWWWRGIDQNYVARQWWVLVLNCTIKEIIVPNVTFWKYGPK